MHIQCWTFFKGHQRYTRSRILRRSFWHRCSFMFNIAYITFCNTSPFLNLFTYIFSNVLYSWSSLISTRNQYIRYYLEYLKYYYDEITEWNTMALALQLTEAILIHFRGIGIKRDMSFSHCSNFILIEWL